MGRNRARAKIYETVKYTGELDQEGKACGRGVLDCGGKIRKTGIFYDDELVRITKVCLYFINFDA